MAMMTMVLVGQIVRRRKKGKSGRTSGGLLLLSSKVHHTAQITTMKHFMVMISLMAMVLVGQILRRGEWDRRGCTTRPLPLLRPSYRIVSREKPSYRIDIVSSRKKAYRYWLISWWLVLEIAFGPLTTNIKNSNNYAKFYVFVIDNL